MRLTSALGDYAVARSDGMADDHPVNRIVADPIARSEGVKNTKAIITG